MFKMLLLAATLSAALGSAHAICFYKDKEGNLKDCDTNKLVSQDAMRANTISRSAPDKNIAEQRTTDLSAACLTAARDRISYKDPNSLHIEGAPIMGYTIATGEARRSITIMVNGKNSYGAYVGVKPVTCALGTDNTQVIKVIDSY